MIKTIIIEDEPKASRLLREMLKGIEEEISVVEICQDLPCAIKSIKQHKPDLIFLDVELPVYSGLQLLEFLTPEEISFKIIFTTASNLHAIRAFDMSAVDYVLKPIQHDKLKNAIQKYLDNRAINSTGTYSALIDNINPVGIKKIVVPVLNGFEILKIEEIVYIKAEGSYANIFLKDAPNLLVSHNLKYFEDLLKEQQGFIRIHRSYLANVHFARKITRAEGSMLILENQEELPISPERMQIVLSFFQYQKKNAPPS